MRWSIRHQLVLPLVLLLIGVAGVSLWTAWRAAHSARARIEAKVRDVARTLSASDFPLTQRVLEQMRGLSGAEYVVAADSGLELSTFPPEALPESLPREIVAEDWRNMDLRHARVIAGHSYLYSGLRLRRVGGDQYLYVFYPESLWRDALWQAVVPSLVFGFIGGGAALGLALALAQRLGNRFQELERRTRMIAEGDFSPMPVPSQADEIQDLCRSINEMARRLSELQETVKNTERLRLLGQVGGGLAHQIRNAVAGARLAVQLHEKECEGPPGDDALEVALRQLALVETSIKRFLDLGKDQKMSREPCPLADVVDESVGLMLPQSRHAHVDLRWQRPAEAVEILGDREQLGHLFVNVLMNAVEAAGPHGWVEVTMACRAEHVAIDVRDSGKGPPAEVARRLFQPFVTGKREGVGLGLVVARRVAEAHGGSIQWKGGNGGTWFSIELPRNQLVEAVP